MFESIISGLEWIINNKDTVIGALKAIILGWGALKLTGGALDMLKLVQGLQGLTSGGTDGTGGTGTTGTGTNTTNTGGKPVITGTGNVDVNTDVVMLDSGVGGLGFVFSDAVDQIAKNTQYKVQPPFQRT